MGHQIMPSEFFPKQPSLPWQQNLGHNGLELGFRKRHIENLCVRWGVLEVCLFWSRAQLYESTHMHPRKNHTINIRKIFMYLPTKNISIFSNIAIIN